MRSKFSFVFTFCDAQYLGKPALHRATYLYQYALGTYMYNVFDGPAPKKR